VHACARARRGAILEREPSRKGDLAVTYLTVLLRYRRPRSKATRFAEGSPKGQRANEQRTSARASMRESVAYYGSRSTESSPSATEIARESNQGGSNFIIRLFTRA